MAAGSLKQINFPRSSNRDSAVVSACACSSSSSSIEGRPRQISSGKVLPRTKGRSMSGLADELLADLDGLSGDENEEEQQESPAPPPPTTAESSSSSRQKRKLDDLNSDDEMSGGEGEEEGEEEREGREVGSLVLEAGVKPADELDAEDVQQMELGNIDDINKIAKLEGSKRMTDILKVSPPPSSSLEYFLTFNAGDWRVSGKPFYSVANGTPSPFESGIQCYCTSK